MDCKLIKPLCEQWTVVNCKPMWHRRSLHLLLDGEMKWQRIGDSRATSNCIFDDSTPLTMHCQKTPWCYKSQLQACKIRLIHLHFLLIFFRSSVVPFQVHFMLIKDPLRVFFFIIKSLSLDSYLATLLDFRSSASSKLYYSTLYNLIS